jgi:hypothetical protein
VGGIRGQHEPAARGVDAHRLQPAGVAADEMDGDARAQFPVAVVVLVDQPDQRADVVDAIGVTHDPVAHVATRGVVHLAFLLAAKNAFYAILLEGCRNRVVGQMLTQLNNRVTLLRRLSLGRAGRLPETLAELEAIVQAIEARDAKRAGRLCAAHVARAAKVVRSAFPDP